MEDNPPYITCMKAMDGSGWVVGLMTYDKSQDGYVMDRQVAHEKSRGDAYVIAVDFGRKEKVETRL